MRDALLGMSTPIFLGVVGGAIVVWIQNDRAKRARRAAEERERAAADKSSADTPEPKPTA